MGNPENKNEQTLKIKCVDTLSFGELVLLIQVTVFVYKV